MNNDTECIQVSTHRRVAQRGTFNLPMKGKCEGSIEKARHI